MTKVITTFFLCSILFAGKLQAQSLLKDVEDSVPVTEKVSGAFKSTRVINAHSVEMLHRHNLDFRIMHRFGFISSGVKQLYGLDNASMRISFDYGLSDNTTIGFGRSTFRNKNYTTVNWAKGNTFFSGNRSRRFGVYRGIFCTGKARFY